MLERGGRKTGGGAVWQLFVCRLWGASVVANRDCAFGELIMGESIMDWVARGAAAKSGGDMVAMITNRAMEWAQ